MSNYPPTPSFGGQFNYVQQWPPHPPPSNSSIPSISPNFAMNRSGRRADFNDPGIYNTAAHLPGLGIPNASINPYFFGNQLSHGQFPNPFSPAPMIPMTYQPIPPQPAHAGAHRTVGSTLRGDSTPFRPQGNQPIGTLQSIQDDPAPAVSDELDREEGEVSEMNGDSSPDHNDPPFSRSPLPPIPCTIPYRSIDTVHTSSRHLNTLEAHKTATTSRSVSNSDPEGPAAKDTYPIGGESSDSSLWKGDHSESPYNPTTLVNGGRQDVTVEDTTGKENQPSREFQRESDYVDNKDNRPSHIPGKTAAQLRVAAQGALLSLAPHNIRYHDLVGEGIDSTVLRQLYEEVGIKIAPTEIDAEASAKVITHSNLTPTTPANGKPSSAADQADSTKSQNDTNKPLERKEVIARMLAAKANKMSQPITTTKPERAEIPSSSVASNAAPAPIQPVPADIQPKEKNKAQTELARQRIEQLKKQGLPKSQQRPQAAVTSPASLQLESTNVPASQTSSQESAPVGIHHPLPSRPPDPEPAPTAKIPGLFMTQSGPSAEPQSHFSTTTMDSLLTQAKTMPRKRPRASDFDEMYSTFKKPLVSEDRLIIDISEDESIYDDEGDIQMTEPPSQTLPNQTIAASRNFPPLADFPTRKVTQQAASITPQTPPRPNDPENLRQKDIEIQAMRRRIAEYESRKKTKPVTNRAQSSGSLDRPATLLADDSPKAEASLNATPSALTMSTTMQPANQGKLGASPVPPPGFSHPSLRRSASVQSLVSMDSAHLDNIRQKILRKQEIESGLPALDAELTRTEAKLAEFKKEEERLLAEIAKGREGRKQLIDELESLGVETEGLTMEELQAAKDDIEQRGQSEVAQGSATSHPLQQADSLEAIVSTYKATSNEPLERPINVLLDGLQDRRRISAEINEVAEVPEEQDITSTSAGEGGTDTFVEPEDTRSPSTGSSISESIASVQNMPVDQVSQSETHAIDHTRAAEAPAVRETEMSDVRPPMDETRVTSQLACPPDLQVPTVAVDIVSDHESGQSLEDATDSRESSVASALYEPPEPVSDLNEGDSTQSPLFSPSGPDYVEADTVPVPPSSLFEADEALTKTVQGPKGTHELRFDILEHKKPEENAVPRFSPYMSPLRYFRSYRYHPNFTEDVSEGYRSLTYSHNIDLNKTVCPYEAAGGFCNDATCDFQHWRDMVSTDDKILVQMGSLREGKTPEERESYIDGLKQIINDMRRDKVKDFNTVATEIAAYRRRFLQDPSRVIPL